MPLLAALFLVDEAPYVDVKFRPTLLTLVQRQAEVKKRVYALYNPVLLSARRHSGVKRKIKQSVVKCE